MCGSGGRGSEIGDKAKGKTYVTERGGKGREKMRTEATRGVLFEVAGSFAARHSSTHARSLAQADCERDL